MLLKREPPTPSSLLVAWFWWQVEGFYYMFAAIEPERLTGSLTIVTPTTDDLGGVK
jgi:hypothetical protein